MGKPDRFLEGWVLQGNCIVINHVGTLYEFESLRICYHTNKEATVHGVVDRS